MIDVITVRGTSEPQSGSDNVLTNVTRLLDPAKYRYLADCVYPASVGTFNNAGDIVGVSEAESVIAAVADIAELARSTPDDIGLLGYSLGAESVSTFLVMLEQGHFPDLVGHISWAGTVANPVRAQGDSFDQVGAPGEGINGAHLPYPVGLQTWEIANPLDGITCTPLDSPLRAASDVVSNYTFANLSWGENLLQRLLARDWQPVDWGSIARPIITVEEYLEAAQLVYGYVFGGEHQQAYLDGNYFPTLAAAINA